MSAVESPDHYTQGYIEAIYLIKQTLGYDGFKAFCMGNYLKYQIRHAHKGGKEDLKKAQQYLEWSVNGLPDPVNNRVPRSKVEPKLYADADKPDRTGSIAALLQHELDVLEPAAFKVTSIAMTPWVNGYCSVNVWLEWTDGVVGCNIRLNLPRVSAAVRYTDVVTDLIANMRETNPGLLK